MDLRLIDWIWNVRGTVALAPGQSIDDALDRLDPLFRQSGTSHERTDHRLTFQKRDQAAQDKMSVFDAGVIEIENRAAGPVLRYRLTSRALLFCFLLPLLFLGMAQLTTGIGKLQKSAAEAAGKPGKSSHAPKKPTPKKAEVPMNPIDKALGAPAPAQKEGNEKAHENDKKPSPTAAYVFAAIFALLYIAGRILEDRLFKALLTKSLLTPDVAHSASAMSNFIVAPLQNKAPTS